MKNPSSALARLVGIGFLAISGLTAAQQTYPNKPIRFIVPYPPGGITTVITHLVGQNLTSAWGQPVIVDNRPGGNAVIGTDALAKSTPDGYTILLIAAAHVVVPHLLPTPYDALKDFAPVASLDASDQILVLSPSVPVNTLQELIAYAKARPGQLNYASAGNGSSNHLTSELLNQQTGMQIRHIPYKGSGQAVTDVISGQVQMTFNNPLPVAPFVKSGKLKAIVMSGDKRSSAMPDVPTFSEAGLPGFEAKNWHGVLAPAGTPRDIVSKLSAEFGRIMNTTDVKEKLVSQGVEPFITNPDQFAALLRADFAKWGKVIKAANIKIDN